MRLAIVHSGDPYIPPKVAVKSVSKIPDKGIQELP